MSPISSRNSVPPLASSNRPVFWAIAPVKAPFSWPKSSLSSNVSGRAAQLIAIKGLSRRCELAWMCRLNISLPVPVSPRISTVALLPATRAHNSSTCRSAGDCPMMLAPPSSPARSPRFSSFSRSWACALVVALAARLANSCSSSMSAVPKSPPTRFEHLHHADHVVFLDHRGRHQPPGDEARFVVDAFEERRVLAYVADQQRLARAGNLARDSQFGVEFLAQQLLARFAGGGHEHQLAAVRIQQHDRARFRAHDGCGGPGDGLQCSLQIQSAVDRRRSFHQRRQCLRRESLILDRHVAPLVLWHAQVAGRDLSTHQPCADIGRYGGQCPKMRRQPHSARPLWRERRCG